MVVVSVAPGWVLAKRIASRREQVPGLGPGLPVVAQVGLFVSAVVVTVTGKVLAPTEAAGAIDSTANRRSAHIEVRMWRLARLCMTTPYPEAARARRRPPAPNHLYSVLN